MTNDDLKQIRGVVKEELDSALEPIKETLAGHTKTLADHTKKLAGHTKTLADHTKKLDILWEQAVKLTEDMGEVQEHMNTQTALLKQVVTNTSNNKDDIGKLDKRVSSLEDQAGIIPPLELTIVR